MGSLMQRIIDPFAGHSKDENGSIIYTVQDKELAFFNLDNDEKLRKQFESLKNGDEIAEFDADNEDEV